MCILSVFLAYYSILALGRLALVTGPIFGLRAFSVKGYFSFSVIVEYKVALILIGILICLTSSIYDVLLRSYGKVTVPFQVKENYLSLNLASGMILFSVVTY